MTTTRMELNCPCCKNRLTAAFEADAHPPLCLICNEELVQDDLYFHVRCYEQDGLNAVLVVHAKHFLADECESAIL